MADRCEVIEAVGHPNVTARHRSTIEVTTDEFLTPAGDCIVGIGANRAPSDFDPDFVAACRKESSVITFELETPSHRETVTGRGHPALTFESQRCLIGRTSEYIDDRTALIHADRAAADLDRSIVRELADGAPLTVTVSVR